MQRRNVNGAAVKAIRETLGHRAGQFASKATMSAASLCNVEAGRRQPSTDATTRMARTLSVDFLRLIADQTRTAETAEQELLAAITYPVETAQVTARRINGPTVRVLREALQVPGGEFADRVGISHAYLTNVEKGRKQPSAAVMRSIADQLGVPLTSVTYPVLAADTKKAKVA